MLDRHTEIIAHFIGAFQQDIEQAILRLQYDELRALKAKIEEANALLDVNISVRSEMTLDPFDPGVFYQGPADFMAAPSAPFRVSPDIPNAKLLGPHAPAPEFDFDDAGRTIHFKPMPFEIMPPGAWFALLHQTNWNFDNDWLMQRPFELSDEILAGRSDAALGADFVTLAKVADALSILGVDFSHKNALLDGAESGALLERVLDALADREAGVGVQPGAQVHMLHAGTAIGTPMTGIIGDGGPVLMDGVAMAEVPDTLVLRLDARIAEEKVLDQHQPGYVPHDSEEGEEEPEDDGFGDAATAAGETLDVLVHLEPGDSAGATSGVGGLVQTIATGENLLLNEFFLTHVSVDASKFIVGGEARELTIVEQINILADRDHIIGEPEALHGAGSSTAHNVVTMEWLDNAASGPTFPVPASHEGMPASYAVANIAGDLVYSSTTVQINLMTDNDMITFETVFHNFAVTMGDNVLSNAAVLQGFQHGYDMIVVGGDMVTIASIQQMNLLFDNDLVAMAPGTGGNLHTSGNLLWNEANISRSGVDHAVDMSETGQSALDGLASGNFNPFVFDQDDTFQDFYVPTILTIGGDFISQQSLVQINMLTDADTIQIFASILDALGFGRIDVSTGDNVLANIANLTFHGLDSDVMAQNGVYSDAVIYQAGMIDHDGDMFDLDFGDGGLGGLASEAVAFLADGLLNDRDDDGQDCGYGGDGAGGGSGTFDALSTMVA
ncbi:hypothetical protein [Maritimibacter sp. DP1N21-5]|uniref:hypothetical protein n=1 Tax=Maritimibacter sp. DP1N21-5 TaxID=2836867 RepID=UPI001C489608|nr:hypothetical protein [Maritimibacter sp. DP1N21-5]MBV7407669.1 hypothetical protein [Maritimibacter sp. DP1N21-5]